MSYDKNGNITNLKRNGRTSTGSATATYGAMDDLSYNYTGNQLNSVTDAITTNNTVDFVPRNGGNYTYWSDGS
jgi:hypothetical protein